MCSNGRSHCGYDTLAEAVNSVLRGDNVKRGEKLDLKMRKIAATSEWQGKLTVYGAMDGGCS